MAGRRATDRSSGGRPGSGLALERLGMSTFAPQRLNDLPKSQKLAEA